MNDATELPADVEPAATVEAELHYTTFADADAFAALVRRHGLEYAGVTDHYGSTPFVWAKDPDGDEQLLLATGCHPVTGEFHAGGYREEGYASYIYLAGPAHAAEPLYQDLHDTAERIKGEFQPLAPVEGDDENGGSEREVMTDGGREVCENLGCENPPVEGGYCAECIDLSPQLVEDPDAAGEAVNPAGQSVETTETPETPDERVEEHGTGDANPGRETDKSVSSDAPDPERVENAVADLLRHYHRQLDEEIADHTEGGEHPERPTTAREYFREVRGWSDATLDEALLGYAPADDDEVADALVWDGGYTREEILATGLFYDDLTPKWRGRYVLPYRDEDGRPVYGISRCTGEDGGGAAGYDGHPADSGYKYDKHLKSPEYAHPPDEPIFGLGSVEDGEPLLVAGGIADAITLHQAGYPCISPVTTVQFKGDHEERVVELVEERDIPTVYVVNDAERPSVEEKELDGEAESIGDALTIEQHGEGLRGAFADADFLLDAGADVRLVELPRAGRSLRKVDPDDYVHDGWGALDAVLAAAKPAEQHPGYDREERAMQTAANGLERERERSPVSAGDSDTPSGDHSALFDLDVRDVTGRSWGSRGVNPLGHHGNSENYYVLVEQHGVGYDHKYKTAYNALTHLLVEAGERRAENPNGRLDDRELFAAWRRAKEERLIPDDDPIPHRALRHVALDGGLCEREDVEDGWKLPPEAYNDALDAVREEYDLDAGRRPLAGGPGGADAEPVAVLPNSPRAQAATNGWDWMSADRAGVEDALTVDEARERTREAIGDAYHSADRVLVEALPTMGKSYGAVAAAADADEPITMLTTRGNREQYQQIREWCEEHGLKAKVLPSFLRDCETANGEYGEGVAETVREWYRRGATGKDIHIHYENETREPIPCDGPAGARCSYKAGWQFDADDYDVLIGHYLHGHVGSVTHGRTVVFDEFPGDAFETTLGGDDPMQRDAPLAGPVTRYLKNAGDAVPYDDYTDLFDGRDDPDRRARALAHFEDHDPDRDTEQAFDREGHALAPLAAYTILAGAGEDNDLGNGWERASLPESGSIGLFDRENGRVHLLRPPELDPRYTHGVVALDGTPTPKLWELALGTRLNHRPVLTDGERGEYLRDALGINLIRTTENVKPYSSDPTHPSVGNDDTGHVAVEGDTALLNGIADEHGQRPALITTARAEDVYEREDVFDRDEDGSFVGSEYVADARHYGNLKGSNDLADCRLGAVIGSRSFGDGFVKKWGALAGEAVERVGGKGIELEYSGIGGEIHRHMTHHETLQAALRFGRDGGGATVYVHTNTLPEWVEDGALAGEGRVIRTRSDGERQVLDALESDAIGEEWTTGELAAHPAVEVGESQTRRHLNRLADEGYLAREVEGNGFVWRDDGLHRVAEHGEVELGTVDLDELTDEETDCIARTTTYTWDAVTSGSSSVGESGEDGPAVETGGRPARDAVDPPPERPD